MVIMPDEACFKARVGKAGTNSLVIYVPKSANTIDLTFGVEVMVWVRKLR